MPGHADEIDRRSSPDHLRNYSGFAGIFPL
jgi:hypothetical protein